jgi:hypothetical protein
MIPEVISSRYVRSYLRQGERTVMVAVGDEADRS